MPITYDDLGIHFQFPENWSLEANDEIPDRPTVTVYSPGGAFWSVMRLDGQQDVAQMAQEAGAALKQEYPGADIQEVRETLCDVELEGYDLNFIYLDLISTACIRTAHTAGSSYLIVYQAEDREFAKLNDVFRAMTFSLLAEAVGKRSE
jgi:hypothetical protein